MKENPLLSKQLKILTVKIQILETGEKGSGIIYMPKNQDEKTYILTAKHCLCGEDFTFKPKATDIEVEIFYNEKQCYYKLELPDDSSIFYFEENEKDIAIISFPKFNLSNTNQNFPSINLIEDSEGIRNSSIFGFPAGSPNQSLERIDTVLQLPTENVIWKAEPQRTLEAEIFHTTQSSVKGFSGSGFLINTLDEFYLFGIVTDFPEWNRFLGIKIHLINELLEVNGLPLEPFYQLEPNEEVVKAITFLDRNSSIIRTNIKRKSKLGKTKEVFLERDSLQKEVITKINEKKVVIINGHAGYGKSVLAEKILSQINKEYSIWAIKAEQLTNNNIDGFLLENNSTASFSDVLNSPLLLKQKIILIDSTEKLLETQELDGLGSLLNLVNQRDDLKVIFTIRDYALGILITLPKDGYAAIDVPNISESEMTYISGYYPELEKLLQNEKIKQILKIPFYLNFVLQQLPFLIDNEDLDERKLKLQLWKTIINKSNNSRGNLFEKLSLKRAQEMNFFVSLGDENEDIIADLLKDEIIIQFEDKYGNLSYAPSHDIFEDWALVKFIQNKRVLANGNLENFFDNIGNAFALRRGFRFWLQEELNEPNPTAFFTEFILPSLNHPKIQQYWKDEILVSILLSNHCTQFLNDNKEEVLKDNSQLLTRLIHFLRTACRKPFKSILNKKEDNHETKLYSFNFEPIGESWVSIISFIHQNQDIIEANSILILGMLLDWEKKLHQLFFVPSESRMVGEILLIILRLKDLRYSSGYAGSNNKSLEKGLILLLRLTEVMEDEIKSILEKSLNLNKKIEETFKNRREQRFDQGYHPDIPTPKSDDLLIEKFHAKILELSLSCFDARELCYFLPETIIKIAKEKWLLKKQEIGNHHLDRGIDVEHYFGLVKKHKMNYFPASAYQTPTYFLLIFHPIKALNFIIEVVNFSTNCYKDSSFGKENFIRENYVTLNSGDKILKWSNITLWTLYRSLSVGTVKPSLLKSMMMALEKWMLSLGKSDKKEDHQTLIFAVKTLLKNSNSAMTTSVISSISIAYPFILKQDLLPIFTEREFFKLDQMRWLDRKNVLAPGIPRGEIHRKERLDSFNLPQRNEYLELFLLKLSFYEGFLNPIYSILDIHYQEANKDDKAWLLALNRMDRREHEIKENPDNSNQLMIIPKVKENLKSFVEEGEKEREKDRPRVEVSNWSIQIMDKNIQSENTLENWKSYHQQILDSPQEENDFLLTSFSCNSALAYIGLEYYYNHLTKKELSWCFETILNTGHKLISPSKNQGLLRRDIGLLDKQAVIKALPLLLNSTLKQKNFESPKYQIIKIIIQTSLENGNHKSLFEDMVRKLWNLNSEFAIQCFRVLYYFTLIKFPEQDYYHPKKYEENMEKFNSEKEELIKKAVKETLNEIVEFQIEFKHSNSFYYDKLFNFLPEKIELSRELEAFRIMYERALIFETFKSNRRNPYQDNADLINNNLHFQNKYARLLFFQNIKFCDKALPITINSVLSPDNNDKVTHKSIELISGIFNSLIYLKDSLREGERFWHLWKILFDKSVKLNSYRFASTLLFNTETSPLSPLIDWKPLHGKEVFLKEVIQNFGEYDIDAVVELLSGAGAFALLPDGIVWVKNIMEKIGEKKSEEIFYYERLVQRAFFIHRKAIQENPTILKAYIYLLNTLVNAGSSSSFYLREVVMSRLN